MLIDSTCIETDGIHYNNNNIGKCCEMMRRQVQMGKNEGEIIIIVIIY
jgi:hypothetical protein